MRPLLAAIAALLMSGSAWAGHGMHSMSHGHHMQHSEVVYWSPGTVVRHIHPVRRTVHATRRVVMRAASVPYRVVAPRTVHRTMHRSHDIHGMGHHGMGHGMHRMRTRSVLRCVGGR